MTPYEIDILLWYHCRAEDHPQLARINGEIDLPRETFRDFVGNGLLRYVPELARDLQYPMVYVMTDRGHAYCRALQMVPLPISRWYMEWPEWTPETMTAMERTS